VDVSDFRDPTRNYETGAQGLDYTVTITNNGTVATNANFTLATGQPILVAHLPAGVAFASVTDNHASISCSSTGHSGHTDVVCHDSDGLGSGASHVVTIEVNVPDTTCGVDVITMVAVVDPSNVQAETNETVADNEEAESTDVWCADLDINQYDEPDGAPSWVGDENEDTDVPNGSGGGSYTAYHVVVLHNDGVLPIGAMTFGGTIGGSAARTTVTVTAIGAGGTWTCSSTLTSWSCSGSLAADAAGTADEVAIVIRVTGTGTTGQTITYNGAEAVCTIPPPQTGQTNSCRDGIYDPANASGAGTPYGTDPPQAQDTLN
jgi:hypothetical protein